MCRHIAGVTHLSRPTVDVDVLVSSDELCCPRLAGGGCNVAFEVTAIVRAMMSSNEHDIYSQAVANM